MPTHHVWGTANLQEILAYLRAPLAPRWRFTTVLLAMVALRWLMIVVLMLDLFQLDEHVPPWYFSTGGDQLNYFTLGAELARGRTVNELVSLGAALTMVPFVWLTDAVRYRTIVAPLVVINGFILGGASVALTGLAGKEYTGSRRVGLLAAALWLLLPAFYYLTLGLHPEPALLRGAGIPKLMWLNGLSDGPASFAILLGVWALGRAMNRESPRAYFLAGLGFGWAVMTRIVVAPVVALLLGILVLARRWRGLLWVSLGGLLGFLPQAVFNTVEYGFPLYTSYLRNISPAEDVRRPLSLILTQLPYSPVDLVDTITYYTSQFFWLVPLLVLALGACFVAGIILWRERGWPYTLILLGVPLTHITAGVASFVFPGDPIRHSMLAYPYLLIVAAYVVLLIWQAVQRFIPRPA